ncbi:MAG: asparagine synthetase B [Gammaproteobacteria bacterium]
MAGLCGWYRSHESASTPDLQAMARQLPSNEQRNACVDITRYAALVRATDANSGVIEHEGWLVAIEGTPGFHDEALAKQANEQGFVPVLANALRDNPTKTLAKLSGGFSLAAVDAQSGDTWLAVDRMGRRPLCYALGSDNTVLFASHATALKGLDGVDARIDPQSIYYYVYFHVVPSPASIFRGVRKVAPGEVVRIRGDQVTSERYWHPGFGQRPRRPDGPLLPVIRDAVARCGVSPSIGCFLSGGLDSSTVAGVLNEQTDGPANAFTIGFAQEGYDEIEYARTAQRHFGLSLHDYYITGEDVANAFGEVAQAYDEPFGNSSAAPTLICARLAAKNGVTDLLAGDGGDELFAGNERYATQKLFGYYRHVPGFMRAIMEPFFGRASVVRRGQGFQHKVRRYIEQANIPMPARTQTYNLLYTSAPTDVFNPDFLRDVDQQAPLDLMAEAYNTGEDADYLDRMLQTDWKFTLADNDLRKVGRMCDLAGVTVHYPLLDDAVIDHSISVPSSVKLKRMELRSYYKNSTRNFLPDEIINKSKHGFGLPFGEWLRKDDQLREIVGSRVASLKERGVFSVAWIDQLLEQHRSDHAAYYGNFVWVLAMFEEWCQQHQISW